jgi:hypothetical protein
MKKDVKNSKKKKFIKFDKSKVDIRSYKKPVAVPSENIEKRLESVRRMNYFPVQQLPGSVFLGRYKHPLFFFHKPGLVATIGNYALGKSPYRFSLFRLRKKETIKRIKIQTKNDIKLFILKSKNSPYLNRGFRKRQQHFRYIKRHIGYKWSHAKRKFRNVAPFCRS